MKIYNTYQEAKIANPDRDIYENDNGEFGTRDQLSKIVGQYIICEPKDHCMTTKEFSDKGLKANHGDVYLSCAGIVIYVDFAFASEINKSRLFCSESSFILRAADLEQIETPEEKEALDAIEKVKPKHTNTKVEYVKIDCQSLEFWECAKEYQSKMHTYWKDNEGKQVIQDLNQLVEHYRAGIIYRKVAKELTERELFIDTALNIAGEPIDSIAYIVFERLFDSGKFKLVDGE